MAAIAVAVALVAVPAASHAAPAPTYWGGASPAQIDPVPEPTQVDACNPADRGRFADCTSRVYGWNLRKNNPVTGPIVGTAMASVTLSEVTAWDSKEWTARYTARIFALKGEAEVGTTAAVTAECRGDCTILSGASQPNVPVSENSVVTGEIRFAATSPKLTSPTTNPPLASSSQLITLHLFHPTAVGSATTGGSDFSALGPVRCDEGNQRYGVRGRPGCVVPEYDPTFRINHPENEQVPSPLHAKFVADAQANPKTQGLGRPGSGNPLIREYKDKRAQAKKRAMVCPSNFARNPSPAGTPPELQDSCDEYPYSTSKQGVPQFAITGHVPQGDNTRAGSQLSTFYAKYHVIDGDAYYVQP